MKKILSLLFLVVIGFGVWLGVQYAKGNKPFLDIERKFSSSEKTEKNSLAAEVSDDSLAYISFSPENLKPFFDYLKDKANSLKDTELGKKIELEKILNEEKTSNETIESIIIKDLKALEILIPDKLQNVENTKLPVIAVRANFKNGQDTKALLKPLAENLVKESKGSIIISEEVGGESIKVQVEEDGVKFTGRLISSPNKIDFVTGVQTLDELKNTTTNSSIADNSSYIQGLGTGTKDFLKFYVNYQKALPLIKEIADSFIALENKKSPSSENTAVVSSYIDRFMDQYKGLYSSGGKFTLTDGLRGKWCTKIEKTSEVGKLLNAMADSKSESDLYKFVNQNTLLAVGISKEKVVNFASQQASQFSMIESLGGLPKEESLDVNGMSVKIKKAVEVIKNLSFTHMGLYTEQVKGMPMPSGVILLSNSSLKGEDALKDAANFINSIGSLLDLGDEVAEISDNKLVVNISPSIPLVGEVFNNNSVMISMDEGSLANAKESANKNNNSSIFSELSSNDMEALKSSTKFFFLSGEAILGLVRPFIPLGLASAGIQGKDAEAIDNLLDQLKGRIVVNESYLPANNDIVCVDSFAKGLSSKP